MATIEECLPEKVVKALYGMSRPEQARAELLGEQSLLMEITCQACGTSLLTLDSGGCVRLSKDSPKTS